MVVQPAFRMEPSTLAAAPRSYHKKAWWSYLLVGAALMTLGVVVVAAWLDLPFSPWLPQQRQEGLRNLASFADLTSSSYRTSHSSNSHNNNDDDSKTSNDDDSSSSSNNDDDSASSSDDDSTSTSQTPSTDDDTVSSLISASITVRDDINASSYQTTTTAGNATTTTPTTKGNHTASSSKKKSSSSSSTTLQLPPEPDQPSWWPLGISGGLVLVATLACLVTCVCRQSALKRSSYQPIPHSTTLVV